MMFERVFEARGALDTHNSAYYRTAWKAALNMTDGLEDLPIVDPFARECPWADHRNDADPQFLMEGKTTACMDALEFMEWVKGELGPRSCRIILLDPPFSDRQAQRYMRDKDAFKGHPNLYALPGYMGSIGSHIRDLLAPGGVCVKLGFNSNAPHQGLQLVKGWCVAFGGNRNDVMVSIWKRVDDSLERWTQ
jgi:hypothetical protein